MTKGCALSHWIMQFLPNLPFIIFLNLGMYWMQNMQAYPPILRMANSLSIYTTLIFWCSTLQHLIALVPQSYHSSHILLSLSTKVEVVMSISIVFSSRNLLMHLKSNLFVSSKIMVHHTKNTLNFNRTHHHMF